MCDAVELFVSFKLFTGLNRYHLPILQDLFIHFLKNKFHLIRFWNVCVCVGVYYIYVSGFHSTKSGLRELEVFFYWKNVQVDI
jgi:hypothetical protein